jgi:hypothetical protein
MERKSWRCCDTLCLVRSWSCFSRCANHSNRLVSKEEEKHGELLQGEILNNFWTIFYHHSYPHHRAPRSYLNHSHPDSWWRISHFYYQPAIFSLVDISFIISSFYSMKSPWNHNQLPLKSPLKTHPLYPGDLSCFSLVIQGPPVAQRMAVAVRAPTEARTLRNGPPWVLRGIDCKTHWIWWYFCSDTMGYTGI